MNTKPDAADAVSRDPSCTSLTHRCRASVEGGCLFDEIVISSNRPNDRSWMSGLGCLAMGERRDLHTLTKRQDVGANDSTEGQVGTPRSRRMAEREAWCHPNGPTEEEHPARRRALLGAYLTVGIDVPAVAVVGRFGHPVYCGPYCYEHSRYWRRNYDRYRFDRFPRERWYRQ
jgi:hypothetical protein